MSAAQKKESRRTLEAQGIDFSADFHALPGAQVQLLIDRAKHDKYKAPADANGSTARYFFYRLARGNK
jgi:hypothetical protein